MGYVVKMWETYLDVRVARVDGGDEAEVRLWILPIDHFVGTELCRLGAWF